MKYDYDEENVFFSLDFSVIHPLFCAKAMGVEFVCFKRSFLKNSE